MKFINQKFVLLILSLIMFSLHANAHEQTFEESNLSEKGKQAYQSLLKIKLFAIGGIGYAGRISEGEKSFDVLLEEKQPALAFRSLVKNGTLEGGMYGLFGLKMIDCDCFPSDFESYKKERILDDKEEFSMMSGCDSIKAENKSDKEFVVSYVITNVFEQKVKNKKILREQRKRLKERQDNNGADKKL